MVTSLHRCGFWKAVHKRKAVVPDEYKTFIDKVCISNNEERRVRQGMKTNLLGECIS